jgi:hypothetical protein
LGRLLGRVGVAPGAEDHESAGEQLQETAAIEVEERVALR